MILAWPGQAADFRLLQLDGYQVKWGEPVLGTGATVTWAFAERRQMLPGATNCRVIQPVAGLAGRAGIEPAVILAAFRDAFRLWENVADITFEHVSKAAAADVLIGAQGLPKGIAYANVWHEPRPGAAVSKLKRATICLNPLVYWETSPDGRDDTYNIRHVAAHEIGHVIGLDHPGPAGQLMGFQYSEGNGALQLGDVRGALALYGARPSAQWGREHRCEAVSAVDPLCEALGEAKPGPRAPGGEIGRTRP